MALEQDNELKKPETELPLLPLKDIVVFPHMIVPVFVNEEVCVKAVESTHLTNRKIFLSAFKVPGHKEKGLESSLAAPFDVYDIGTICSVMRTRKLADGRMKVLIQGIHKAQILELTGSNIYPKVRIRILEEGKEQNSDFKTEAILRAVKENLEKVVGLGKVLSPDILMILDDVKEPGRLSDLIVANLGLKVEDAQKILSTLDPFERLQKVHAILSREIEVFQMQVQIQSQAKEEIGKAQREHYLREQIKALKNELGDNDPKDELKDFWKQINQLELGVKTKEELTRQVRRLERMHQDSSEATLTRTYIETVLSLPWGVYSKDHLDLHKVGEILDKQHHGLDQVKDRIIEFLAVKKLNPKAKSPILCFVGPPGVGKTSLGKSIAQAMGRNFSRISLGGVKDEADIRGHRKTYVGAFPGRIVQSIKQAKSSNPIIMLDEIDKIGSDHRGDPSAALLEVLDPEQNNHFIDHYLGVPYDLSKVLFIANANTLDTIPPALKDRLEVIEVSGYSEDEKLNIATKFLIPKQQEESGLMERNLTLSKDSILCVIREYTRESGLRSLEKQIASIFRKIARLIAEDKKISEKITPITVRKYLGIQRGSTELIYHSAQIGVSLGLAYTQTGGEVLAIETNLLPGNGNLVLTGHLGTIMKESAQAAFSFIKSKYSDFCINPLHLKKYDLHVHVPHGAVPKEGPSAGIAITTSMISALIKCPPLAETCMTGEITLHGMVLPIGGLKEKILAAQRAQLKYAILPLKNKADFDALPLAIRKKTTPIYISNYQEIYPFLFEYEKSVSRLEKKGGEDYIKECGEAIR